MTVVSARVVALIGGVLMVISAGLPWFRVVSDTRDVVVVPLTGELLQSSGWLLVLAMAAGLALLVRTDSPALIGCVSALWLNVSIAVWIFGSKSAWLFPLGSLSGDAAITVGTGMSVGLLGAFLGVIGSALILADQTWTLPDIRLSLWVPLGAAVLAIATVAVREVPWATARWGSRSWAVDFGAVPILGDLLAFIALVSILLLLASVFRPRPWVSVGLIVVGVVTVIDAVVALTSSTLVADIARVIIEQVGNENSELEITATRGPIAVLVVGAATVVFGIMTRRQYEGGEALPSRPVRQESVAAQMTPDDPFAVF